MKKEVLSHFTNPDLILMSFLLFFFVFLFLLYKVFFITSKKEHEKHSLIPLFEKKKKIKENDLEEKPNE